MLQTQSESMQGVMCSWCPELCRAPKQQDRNWLLLQNPLGQGKGVSSSQTRKSSAVKMGIVFFLSVNLSLLSTALDFCWWPVLFKDLAFIQSPQSHALHKKHSQKNSNFSIILLNKSAAAEYKSHHLIFCMQSCL